MTQVKVPASSSSVLISCPQPLLVVFLHDLSRVCVEAGKEEEEEREGGGSGASTCPATNSLIRPLINTFPTLRFSTKCQYTQVWDLNA